MSGTNEDRWRGGRAFDNRQSGQRNANTRTMSGPRSGQQSSIAPSTSWADEVDEEQHNPVGGFNAAEAKAALRRGPGAPRSYFYKPPGKDANNRASGAWGSKPNTMANGKDFFLELRKQVTDLRQAEKGENSAGG